MSRLEPFAKPTPPSKNLFKASPDTIPSTEELESRLDELQRLRRESLERSRKAGEHLKTIERAYKKLRDVEKGKGRADDRNGHDPKNNFSATTTFEPTGLNRTGSLPIGAGSSRESPDPRGDPKKVKNKKKRKLEGDDSGIESVGSPAPSVSSSQPSSQVASKSIKLSIPPKHTIGQDFSIPLPNELLPWRALPHPPPVPGPSKPEEVMTDFSQTKQPTQQTPITTFYSSIEPWTRPIREEDIGFLEWSGDTVEPFVVPKLGKFYLDVWAEEELLSRGGELRDSAPTETYAGPPDPNWDSTTLSDMDLTGEMRGHGPLTERLVTGLLPVEDSMSTWRGVKAAEDAMEGRPGGSGAAAAKREKINVKDLENRIRDTMIHHGLLDHVPNFTDRVDDPIAFALRQAQEELRYVMLTNNARKARLASVARDRLGYQEYIELRDAIDKNIVSQYSKLQKRDLPRPSKKKKKEKGASESHTNDDPPVSDKDKPPPRPGPAALGLNPNDDYVLNLPDSLKQLMETRRQWVDMVGSHFVKTQAEHPGRIWGLPELPIFEGIEEEVRLEQERLKHDGAPLSGPEIARLAKEKGKARLKSDAMDIS